MLCIQKNPRTKHHKSVVEAHQYIIRAPDWTNDLQKITISGQHIAFGKIYTFQSPDTAGNLEQYFLALYEGGTDCILLPTSFVQRTLPQDRAPSEHNEQDVHQGSVCSLRIAINRVDLGCLNLSIVESSRKAMAVSLARPEPQTQQISPHNSLTEGLSQSDDEPPAYVV